jgi:hypothetical protein
VAKGSANEILSLFIEAEGKGYIAKADYPRYETAARNRHHRTLSSLPREPRRSSAHQAFRKKVGGWFVDSEHRC